MESMGFDRSTLSAVTSSDYVWDSDYLVSFSSSSVIEFYFLSLSISSDASVISCFSFFASYFSGWSRLSAHSESSCDIFVSLLALSLISRSYFYYEYDSYYTDGAGAATSTGAIGAKGLKTSLTFY